MKFTWDENKAASNLAKHGLEIGVGILVFDDPFHLTKTDDRHDYGEIRMQTIGKVGDTLIIIVIHTDRLGTTRLISVRRANKKERKIYEDGKNNRHDR